jgi:hypothetical protein
LQALPVGVFGKMRVAVGALRGFARAIFAANGANYARFVLGVKGGGGRRLRTLRLPEEIIAVLRRKGATAVFHPTGTVQRCAAIRANNNLFYAVIFRREGKPANAAALVLVTHIKLSVAIVR